MTQDVAGRAPVGVGLIGCGHISAAYLRNCSQLSELKVVACADVAPERASSRAAEFGVPSVCSVEDLLHAREVEIVLNLTNPTAHADITLAALALGKHVYSEKPLATDLLSGRRILDAAHRSGLLVGCAPDTFLGTGLQAGLDLLHDGAIGRPAAAAAYVMGRGMEMWHPQPHSFYQVGGGPLFDLGPYSLTALALGLGPVQRVSGVSRTTFPQRLITSQPHAGTMIAVEVPTYIAALLEYESGPVATVTYSWDIWGHHLPHLEIYGTEGSLQLPDPNTFGGPVRLRRQTSPNWEEVMSESPDPGNLRGLGLAEMARAVLSGQQPQASGKLAYHVLEIMHAILESAELGRPMEVESDLPAHHPVSAMVSPTAD